MKKGLLAGAIILSVAFGSLHAFSVLAMPLQEALGASRASVSFGYALAIMALTVAVYVAPLVMRKVPPAVLAVYCGAVAAAGLLLAVSGWGLASFLAGYAVMFGFANGIAYSLFLDRASSAFPHEEGFAIGLVTATYGGGAALFAPILGLLTDSYSVFAAFVMLGAAVLLCALLAAYFFASSAFATTDRGALSFVPLPWTLSMWLVYFFGVAGGLMIIGHTAPLVESRYPGTALGSFAVILVAIGNIAGSIGGGAWAQRSSQQWALALPVIVSAVALAVLFSANGVVITLAALCAIGLAYGGLIAAIPVVVFDRVGPRGFVRAFGRIFSAWGVAGLTGPSIAGLLFDHTGSYNSALLFAGGVALISLIVIKVAKQVA